MRVFSLWLASRGDVALSISRTVARSRTFFGLTCGGVGSEADGVMVTVSVDQVGAGVMSTEDVLISVADTTFKKDKYSENIFSGFNAKCFNENEEKSCSSKQPSLQFLAAFPGVFYAG